ncbi:MAG TPA: nucleotidyltransferase family protein [Gammaproteobacteria bacterium]|nr:nucleotidyltransferase family protein [Gammaproteobacteria bacterium]
MPNVSALLLAAGLGTRLRPLTENWPKCLMPVANRPLLEYWLGIISRAGINDVLVNLHYHPEIVRDFLYRPQFREWVKTVYEPDLMGTAGTLRENADFFHNKTVLLVHADNWCCCDFSGFLNFHHNSRPANTVMTMMTFESQDPSSCGIVELDAQGIVQGFHEKVKNPPGKLANAAVYLLEPEVIEWIETHPAITDFSTQVLPHLIGRIATWQNRGVHRDIGTVEVLKEAQNDKCELSPWTVDDEWQNEFMKHPIHQQIKT